MHRWPTCKTWVGRSSVFALWTLVHNKLTVVIQSWNLFHRRGNKWIPLFCDGSLNLWLRSLKTCLSHNHECSEASDLPGAPVRCMTRHCSASWRPFKLPTVPRCLCGWAAEKHRCWDAKWFRLVAIFSSRHMILFRYDSRHLSRSLHVFRSKASKYNPPTSKDLSSAL